LAKADKRKISPYHRPKGPCNSIGDLNDIELKPEAIYETNSTEVYSAFVASGVGGSDSYRICNAPLPLKNSVPLFLIPILLNKISKSIIILFKLCKIHMKAGKILQ
jgi:hypothetical protein